MNEDLSLVQVCERQRDEIEANGARVRISVQGTDVFAGKAALREAREVRELLGALEACGIAEHEVGLSNVFVNVHSGLFGRSSAAVYTLLVRCDDVEQVPALIEVVSERKHCTLRGIEWTYDADDEHARALLARCLRKAADKAAVMAAALGAELDAVHRCAQQVDQAPPLSPPFFDETMLSRAFAAPPRRRSGIAAALGSELAPSRTLDVGVTVTYRLRPARPAAAARG